MDVASAIDPYLRRFRETLTELYAPRGSTAWCCSGSRARGDAGEASDYDVAVFLKDLTGPAWPSGTLFADLRTRVLEAGGPFFEAIPFRSSDYDRPTALMREIRRDGVVL